MEDRLYLDIHILQTVPPSCVNRDDTGSPKTAVYGGSTRARVSSQSWKKAVRDMFRNELLPQDARSNRTKQIVNMVAEEIKKLGGDDPEKNAQKILEYAGLKIKSVEKGTDALFFMSIAQARALANLIVNSNGQKEKDLKDKAKQALKDNPGIDIALFGRMVADDPSLNTDACAQVAHSISTHKISNEYDYFTAVDDCMPEDNAGAGHIGTIEFNSSTLYRYATIAVHGLSKQLGTETSNAVSKFIEAFIRSMPTGKQNTFANRTLPDAVLVTLRADQPINLVGAFEKPVYAGEEGYVAQSAQVFVKHANKIYADWLGKPDKSFAVGDLFSSLADETLSLENFLTKINSEVAERLK